MAENTNTSVAAIKEETTEGTLIPPGAATDYFPLREGFEFVPNLENLETDEIRASIGTTKPIRGLERPTARIPMYLRHSGVEGQRPNWDEFLKSAFGTVTANATERTTDVGSSTTSVVLTAGGSDFARGFAVMSKHGSGFEIRPVHSVSSNTLTLGFALDNAPGSGITMGKCVNYSPANSAHPSFSLWNFRGDGGAIEALAGAKVTEIEWSATAGGFIEQNVSVQGTRFFYNVITLAATDTKIDFTDDDGTFVATLTAQSYRDPHELAAAIQTAMNVASPGETKTVVYQDTDGKFKITSTGTVLSLLFLTGANNANSLDTNIGFTHTDHTGTAAGTGYTSDSAVSWAKYHTPTYDSADALSAKDNDVFIGTSSSTTCICVAEIRIRLTNELQEIPCICETSGISGSVFRKRRVVSDITGEMKRNDVSKFKNYRANDEIRMMWAFGEKSGGNWTAGKCGLFYMPSCTITEFQNSDSNGLVAFELTLQAFVDVNGNGEFYLNFL